MIDVIILNRNLGAICDSLTEDLRTRLGPDDTVTVVDAGSRDEQKSAYTTVEADDSHTQEHGLRFGRGMNLGLKHLALQGPYNPWVLMLPVDAEVVSWDIERLIAVASAIEELVAIKPVESESAYTQLLAPGSLKLAWNLEEGPWLIRGSFIEQQQRMSGHGEFFDRRNFRGYLTSLDLAFRAYANGFCIGISNHIILHENESYLLNRSDLIGTEPLDVNMKLLVAEGLEWLQGKYAIDDPWAFAQVVRLLHDRFFQEHPEYQDIGIGDGTR
jgi:hypothetical protein